MAKKRQNKPEGSANNHEERREQESDMPQNKHQTELIVALDFPRKDWAFDLVDQLEGLPVIYKVGYELFLSDGPQFVRELSLRKNRVFLDLKLHDIPNTVNRAIRQASLLHVEMLTIHLAGGSQMLRAASEEVADISALRPKLLGVSVLTSFDDVRWAEVTKALTGHAVDVSDSVDGLVQHATAWGADGVVCSAHELQYIRENYPGLYTVVPGIRPEGWTSRSGSDDQARVMTPAQARKLGAHAIVMGRPITESKNPREVVESVLKDLSAKALSA